MIIKYINIQSFGKLHNYELNPSIGLNSFCEKNGYGKSTICDFIICMLYGLGKKSKTDFSREHYLSFENNESSGILEILHNDITYKIVRKFNKTSSNDELYFYEDNILNEKILIPGEYILGINKDSFIRTIYFDSTNLNISSNDDIITKMNHYIKNTNRDFNLNDIILKLENAKKEIIPLKQQDEKGSLANTKNKIKSLQNELINKETLTSSLKSYEICLNELNAKLEDLKKEYTTAGTVNEKVSNIEKYNNDLLKLKTYQEQINLIEGKYNGNIITEEDLNEILTLYNNKNELLTKININHLSKDEEVKYSQYSLIFNDKSEEEFDIINNKYLEYEKLKTNNDLTIDFNLINKYKDSNFDLILDEVQSLNNEYINLEESIMHNNNCSNNKNKKIYNYLLILISFILLILGIVLGNTVNFNYYILTLISIIIMLLGLYLHFNNKIDTNNQTNNKYQSFKLRYDNTKNKINNLLSPFGFTIELYNTPSNTIFIAKQEYDNYLEETKKLDILNKNNILINNLQNELKSLYRKYNIFEEDFKINYNTLLQKYSSFKNIIDKQNDINFMNNSLNEQIIEINNKLNTYLIRYNIIDIDIFIKECKEDIIRYKIKVEEYNRLKNEIEIFKHKYNITDYDINIKYIDVKSLSDEIAITTSKINRVIDEIENINDKLEQLSYIEDDLLNEKNKLLKLEEEYNILSVTKEKLLISCDNLNNKYLNNISNKFNEYLNLIKNISGYKFVITKDLNVYIDDEGILRNYQHLSLGERTLLTLCYRLSIIDNIFKDDYFIIIDDLFVNLDNNNLQIALNLIKEVSRSKQVFYLTCHETRAL